MARTLYDLAAADDKRRFSPYCWRIKMALAHKELEVETVPWRFTEKDVIAFSGQGRVPVLVDGDKVVADSWAIANELENRYPDRKSLFGDASARSLTLFVASWADGVLQPAIAQFILADIYAHLHEKDKVYFRELREKRVGTTLEKFCANREEKVVQFRTAVLAPLRPASDQSRSSVAPARLTPIMPSSAPFSGRVRRVRSSSSNRTIQLPPGANGCSISMAAWRGTRLVILFEGFVCKTGKRSLSDVQL